MAWNPYLGRMEPPAYNPYVNPTMNAPQMQVIRVNGIAGANALQLGANSSVIVADETDGNRLFLCMTDGAGFKTVRPIRCTFEDLEPPKQDKINDLEKRVNELEALIHDKLNTASVKRGQDYEVYDQPREQSYEQPRNAKYYADNPRN